MDHADVWVLSPASDSLVDALVRAGELRRVWRGDAYSGGLRSADWPAWWPGEALDTLPVIYRKDLLIYHGADPNPEREYRRVWVDSSANRAYVQFFTT